MTIQQRVSATQGDEKEFAFSRQPRVLTPIEALPFQWPTKASVANEYVESWLETAGDVLGGKRLSKETMKCIASHTSRRDGTCRLTDRALSSRSGRSVASTERDIRRLKVLGLIIADYEAGDSRQERIRILKLTVPKVGRSPQRILPQNGLEVPSTYPTYVEGLDMGERRDV